MVIMYNRMSPHQDVNHAPPSMFSQGIRSIENIPPAQAALYQHVKRAEFHVWGRTLRTIQELPYGEDWGWHISSDGWIPTWSILPEASKACNELSKCGCKSASRGLCKCTKLNCPALHCAPRMAVAIKSDDAKTQLPPKRHRTITFISFFPMRSILKVQKFFRDYAIMIFPPKYHSSLLLKWLF